MLGAHGSGRVLSGAMWIAAAVAASHSSLALAQQATSGATHQVIGHGLTMVVDTRWVEGSGYRPVRFEFTPAVPGTPMMPSPATTKAVMVQGILRPRPAKSAICMDPIL